MARKIWLSLLALLVAFCLGLSVVAAVGATIILLYHGAAPAGGFFFPQGGVFL